MSGNAFGATPLTILVRYVCVKSITGELPEKRTDVKTHRTYLANIQHKV